MSKGAKVLLRRVVLRNNGYAVLITPSLVFTTKESVVLHGDCTFGNGCAVR